MVNLPERDTRKEIEPALTEMGEDKKDMSTSNE